MPMRKWRDLLVLRNSTAQPVPRESDYVPVVEDGEYVDYVPAQVEIRIDRVTSSAARFVLEIWRMASGKADRVASLDIRRTDYHAVIPVIIDLYGEAIAARVASVANGGTVSLRVQFRLI